MSLSQLSTKHLLGIKYITKEDIPFSAFWIDEIFNYFAFKKINKYVVVLLFNGIRHEL